tara:strand:+ start:7376 stop:7846 length:471 start_codon:yes stop_codon:yes gene_type:complete
MPNIAARGFYLVLDKIKDELLSNNSVNTVTTGDLFDIDLNKQNMFPLTHIIINNVGMQEQVLNFQLSILAMDIVDTSKTKTADVLIGNDNEQDILNTQLSVINKLIGVLRQGTLYRDMFQLVGDPTCEPFYDRFENELAGWSCDITIQIPNDQNLC